MVELEVRPAILEPLNRTLRWMASLRNREGAIICPEHGVEHTGKSAGAIILACELLELDPDADRAFLQEFSIEQGRRLAGNLVREGISPCFTFRPGRHDPYNCSNSVIDGGACSDALALLVERLGDTLDAADRDAFKEASVLHARTYLRYAVVDKGVPAQRAWGLTGLTAANRMAAEEPMRRAAYRAIEELESIQHADGSYPYHPRQWSPGHPGASDVSAFYQSRVTGFLIYSLEALGEDPTAPAYREPLERGLDFLTALYGPDGVKVGLVEAKPWYWGASYEVASHPFDIYCLARGANLFGRPRAALAARSAFATWVKHLSPEGVLADHSPGPGRTRSYQCPLFWASNASWLARAARDLERIERESWSEHGGRPRIDWYEQAALARLEDDQVVAWVRGARPACNIHHGSPHGAGLLRVVRKADGKELLARCRLGGQNRGEWSGHAGSFSWGRGWRAGRDALRFSVWIAKTHRRAGRLMDALREPDRTFRRGVLAFGHSRVSSAFDLAPEVQIDHSGLTLTSSLAHRDGTPIAESRLVRGFHVEGNGLVVEEQLLSTGNARGVSYREPESCDEWTRSEEAIRYRLS